MTVIHRFSRFGYHLTIWWWRAERRLGAKGLSGFGVIIER